MEKKMHLRNRKNPQKIIEFIIMYFCVMGVLLLFGAPHAIEYVLDLCCVLLLLYLCTGYKISQILHNELLVIQLLMIVIGILISIVNGVSPLLVVWALRNYMRFVVFFGACFLYLSVEDYEHIFTKLNVLFYLNAVMVAVEFALLHYSADEIGGIFGATQTTNGDLNIFLTVMTTYKIVKWEKKEISIVGLIIIIAIDMFICVVAELKVFFFEIVIIFLLVFIICRLIIPRKSFPFKWITIIIIGIIILRIAIDYLGKIYTNWAGFFSYDNILEELTRSGGYSNRGDINRFTFIGIIDKQVFQGDLYSKIFGIGLGGAEYSGASKLLTSSFYNRFWPLHYYYFSTSWMYIECGMIGLILYIASFLLTFIKGIHDVRQQNNGDRTWKVIGIITSIVSVVLLFYNQSMRLPSAYLVYLMLATIFLKRTKPMISSSQSQVLKKHRVRYLLYR